MTRRAWIAGGVAGLALVVAVGLAIWPAVRKYAPFVTDVLRQQSAYARPFEPYVKSLADRGVEVDLEAMERDLPPDAENGAAELQAAYDALVSREGPPSQWPAQALWSCDPAERDAVELGDPSLRVTLAEFLERSRWYFDRVSAALERPHIRPSFEVDPSTGFPKHAWIPHVQQTVRLLGERGRVAPNDEDRVAAIRDCARIGHRLDGFDMFSQMIGVASLTASTHVLEEQLHAGRLDARKARAALNAELSDAGFGRMDGLLRYLRAEVIWQYREVVAGRIRTVDGDELPPPSEMAKPAAAAMFVGACEAVGEAIPWVQLGYPEWRRRFAKLLETNGLRLNVFLIVPQKLSEALARCDAKTRLARIALAAAEHRQTRGAYPASLADLAWAFPDGVPLDPFTDAPFVYERTDVGVRIASLGRLTDEPPLDEDTLRERVLVWELPR